MKKPEIINLCPFLIGKVITSIALIPNKIICMMMRNFVSIPNR